MAYGDSPFLTDCLVSLRDQSVASRIVVTTSTPSAHIESAAKAFDAPLFVNPERAGIAADWTFAMESTDAAIVTLAHQDDVYYPRFLETSLALLEDPREAAIAFTGYQEIDDEGRRVSSRISRVKHLLEGAALGPTSFPSRGRMRAFLSFGDPLPCSSVTYHRSRLGDFVFSRAYQANLDWDAWLRLLEVGRCFARTPARLIGRRHNPLTETSRLIREGVRKREDLEIFRRLWPSPIAELIAWAYRAGY